MTANEFLKSLEVRLSRLPEEERTRQLNYYRELLDDMMEEGLTEEDAVARLGDPTLAADELTDGNAAPVELAVKDPRAEPDDPIRPLPDGGFAVAADRLRGLNIRWRTGQVVLQSGGGTDVIFRETGGMDGPDPMGERVQNGILYLDDGRSEGFFQGNILGLISGLISTRVLTVEIPDTLRAESLSIRTVSADVLVKKMSAERVQVVTVSGDVDMPGTEIGILTAESVSGDVEITGTIAVLDVKSRSGDVDARLWGPGETVKLSTLSGDVSFNGGAEAVEAETVSGDVDMKLDPCPQLLKVRTVSGDADIATPARAGYVLDFRTISGEVESRMFRGETGEYVWGDGSRRFRVETVSGDADMHMF